MIQKHCLSYTIASNVPLHPPLVPFRSQPANSIRSVCKRIVMQCFQAHSTTHSLSYASTMINALTEQVVVNFLTLKACRELQQTAASRFPYHLQPCRHGLPGSLLCYACESQSDVRQWLQTQLFPA